ncbi:helix-hairpin-helix domain-containing protein [Cohnella cholangitidis]|uniref:DNA-binding protein n=1 Tax=Cohnella cholangitidis TaxID=2598458 RepID=A0A7G5C6K0_9BACL|nr:DNA-directed RNA polymerase subunit alpha C-terminal domain-containing protein [Cohnella cholangitidis]QMV44834.1 DNA-binding protein [Cohnella cholangitidis]
MPENNDFPARLAKPALRALNNVGIVRLEQLTEISEAELKKLHGMGPKAIEQLRVALEARALAFRD